MVAVAHGLAAASALLLGPCNFLIAFAKVHAAASSRRQDLCRWRFDRCALGCYIHSLTSVSEHALVQRCHGGGRFALDVDHCHRISIRLEA